VEVLLLEAHQEVLELVLMEDLQDLQDLQDLAIHSIHQVGLEEEPVATHKVDLAEEMVETKEKEANQAPWKKPFLEFQGMTTQYLQKFQKHLLFVMDKQMEVIMQIQKLNAKHFIFVPMMEMVV